MMFSTKQQIVTVVLILLNLHLCDGIPITNQGVICEEQPRDLFLVVDDSASIGETNMRKVRNFLGELVSSVHIGRDMTRIGLLQFSNSKSINLRFNLDRYYDPVEVAKQMMNMKYDGGDDTRTDLGLLKVADEVFTKTNAGNRADVQDIVIVFTDGESRYRDLTVAAAQILKDRGVRIIAIGAGYQRKLAKFQEELELMASSKDDVKIVDFANLENIVVDIVNKVCREITTTSPPTTKPTTVPSTPSFEPSKLETRPPTTPRIRAPAPPLSHFPPTQPSPTTASNDCKRNVGKDILFLIDGSKNFQRSFSLSEKDFRRTKGLIKRVIRQLKYDDYRVGVMQYSRQDSATMEINFMSPLKFEEIKMRLGLIQQQRYYRRFTGEALVKANNKFYELDTIHHRENNPNVVVLLTRGPAADANHAITEANVLESRNIRLITIGLGAQRKQIEPFLKSLAPKELVHLSKYRGLKKLRDSVLDGICTKAVFTPRPGLPRQSAECQRGPHDIFFVIDGSASIKWANFQKVKTFLMDLVSLLRVDLSHINTGLLQFSHSKRTSTVWQLGKYSEIEILWKLKTMKYQSGTKTNTGEALSRVNEKVFTKVGGDRPDITDIVFIFTDGNAHDAPIAREQAELLKKKGVLVVTIGAGTPESISKFRKELEDMASGPEYAMTVGYDDLDTFAEKAFPLVCRYMRRRRF